MLHKWKYIVPSFLFVLFLLLCPIKQVFATTYYIDATDGNNANNGLTEGTAWKDLTKAGTSPVTTGDTILLQRGETWVGQTLTPAASTTIDAYGTGAKPVINGNSVVARSISITANNVTVSNITVSGATSSMVFVGASNAVINDVDSTGTPIAFRINTGSATLNRVTATNASNAAYFFENSSVVTLNNATSTTTSTGNGFRIINSANVTCNSCTASGSFVDGFSLANTSVFTCNKCKAFNNGSTSDTTSGDGYTSHDTSVMNIHYSIGYGNYKAGVAVTGASSGEVLNSTFYNNVQATNGSGWDGSGDVGIGINATGTWIIKNNITYGHPVEFMISAAAVGGGATVTSDYNLFYDSLGGNAFDYNGSFSGFSAYKTASGKDAHSLNTNPLFTNAGSNDFTLQASSPAINAGTNVGLTSDYNGTAVPQGSAPDMGAFEAIPAATGTPTPTVSPTTTPVPGGSSSSTVSNPNKKDGWKYEIMSGPNFVGVVTFLKGAAGTLAENAQALINRDAHHDDLNVQIKQVNLNEFTYAFPWSQGFNTVSEIYEFSALSAFNGYPDNDFDNPVTIILPYDPLKLLKANPKSLKIASYNRDKKKWEVLKNAVVANEAQRTVATTTKKFSYFVVVYPR